MELAWHHQGNNPQVSIEWNRRIIEIAGPRHDLKGLAVAYFGIGNVKNIQGEYDSALVYYFKSLEYDEKLKRNRGIVATLGNIGLVYESLKDFEKALEHYYKALELSKELKLKSSIANNLNNIAVVKVQQGELDSNVELIQESIDLYKQVLEYDKKSGETYWTAKTYNNLANSINDLGIFTGNSRYFDSALVFFRISLELKESINDLEGMGVTLGNIGFVHYLKKDYPTAISYYLRSLEKAKEYDSKMGIVSALEFLCDAYGDLEDWENAFKYNKQLVSAKDSLLNAQKQEVIADMRTKYDTERAERENQELRAENAEKELALFEADYKRNLLLLAFLLVIALSLFGYLYLRKRQQQKLTSVQLRQQKLRFKAVIEAEEKERMRIAKELHDGVGQLLSVTKMTLSRVEVSEEESERIQTSTDLIDDTINEIRSISHNLIPYSLLKKGLQEALLELTEKINSAGLMEIKLDLILPKDRLEKSTETAIYRIIQEVLNNMIKHSKARNIVISLKKSGDLLYLKMQDDGVGFDTSKIETSDGIGWKNIISRVLTLDGHIKVDSDKGKGTSINIDLAI